MTRHRARSLLLAAAVVLLPLLATASSPRFWVVSTQADLLKGEVDQLAIDAFGRLVLGPAVKPVYDATVPFIWCLATGPDGSVYAGTGNDGKVVRVDRQGKAAVWFDAPELEVQTMAAAPDGTLYFKLRGVEPDGGA